MTILNIIFLFGSTLYIKKLLMANQWGELPNDFRLCNRAINLHNFFLKDLQSFHFVRSTSTGLLRYALKKMSPYFLGHKWKIS